MEKRFQHFLSHLERPNEKVKKKTDWHFFWPNWSSKCVNEANTQIQIHKYSLVKFADRPNKCYIFEKEMVPGPK